MIEKERRKEFDAMSKHECQTSNRIEKLSERVSRIEEAVEGLRADINEIADGNLPEPYEKVSVSPKE
jgi:archaellum component FlaC